MHIFKFYIFTHIISQKIVAGEMFFNFEIKINSFQTS